MDKMDNGDLPRNTDPQKQPNAETKATVLQKDVSM